MPEELEAFLRSEFGINESDLVSMEEETLDKIWDACHEIEIDEVIKSGDGNERATLAADLADWIYDNLFDEN